MAAGPTPKAERAPPTVRSSGRTRIFSPCVASSRRSGMRRAFRALSPAKTPGGAKVLQNGGRILQAPVLFGKQTAQHWAGILAWADLKRTASVDGALEILNEGDTRRTGFDVAVHPIAVFCGKLPVQIFGQIAEDLAALRRAAGLLLAPRSEERRV